MAEENKEAKPEGTEEIKPDEDQETEQEEAPEQRIELPPVDFINFINNLASTAFGYLGGFRNPETDSPIVSLEFAKHHIDTIEMLQAKTKGNLTAPEANFLENTLYNLRISYVRMSSAPPPTQESAEEKPEEEPQTDSEGEKTAEE